MPVTNRRTPVAEPVGQPVVGGADLTLGVQVGLRSHVHLAWSAA